MEVFLTRGEIVRRVMARLGLVTTGGQQALVSEQIIEYVRVGAQEVYQRCQWVRLQRETRVDVGIDQRVLNYPAGAGPENIISIGVWDGSRYLPMRRTRITLPYDDEPVQDVGEPASIAGRGRPDRYELKNQIEIWRRPDQAYELKIDHTVNPDLALDTTTSVVDAEAIICWALGEYHGWSGDQVLKQDHNQRFDRRISALIAWQHPRTVIERSTSRGRSCDDGGYVPNSGQWPSVGGA